MGTIPTADNAGIFLRRVDKSQIPASLAPNVLYAALAVKSERGFTNQVYTIQNSYERTRVFGQKDYRKWGTSSHDLDKYLESKNPAYVVRAGDADFKLAGVTLIYDAVPFVNVMVNEAHATITAMITALGYGVRTVFRCTSSADTTDDRLAKCKGTTDPVTGVITPSAIVSGDCFLVTSANSVEFVRNQASGGVQVSVPWLTALRTTFTDGQYATAAAMITALSLTVNSFFYAISTNDTTDDSLKAAKDGVAVANDDYFMVTSPSTIVYKGSARGGKIQAALTTYVGDEFAHLLAKGEGTWGNNISIEITPFTVDKYNVEYSDAGVKLTGDGTRGSTVEIFYNDLLKETFDVSMRLTDVDNTGASIYAIEKFKASDYVAIYVKEDYELEPQLQTRGIKGTVTELHDFAGGLLGAVIASNFLSAFKLIIDYPNAYDVFLALNAGCEIAHVDFDTAVTANGRCFGISAATKVKALDNTITATVWATTERAGDYVGNNFLVSIFNQWVLTLEAESGQDIYISPVGYAARVIGVQSAQGQLPYAPAGYRRGNLVGAKGLSRDWTPTERVTLVTAQWNPIKSDRYGTVFWDEWTTQTYRTAFSNAHVALSYLAQMRGIENTLRGFEFEFNDRATVDQAMSILQDLADAYVREKYAEEILVDDKDNVIGSDQVRIRWNIRFKEAARTFVIDVVAYPSTKELSVSMAELG